MDVQLIKTINKLQDAFASVGVQNPIDLPQIVVIGSQSSGKSSVLENIVGQDFLPRGSGIVTRRPLVLQLINTPAKQAKEGEKSQPTEWGEFLHLPGTKFTDFDKIRDEIVKDTEAKTGRNLGISSLPINLRIFSPDVLTLTLVDLPGLTKVPVGDQPKNIETLIREMLLKYVKNSNAIILAVTAANTDLANSDGLKLAREIDVEGLRTIGVLTKLDLMDQGTDVVDILAGRVIPLRLGYVPVVNRGQKDINNKKSIKAALEYEKTFFENHSSYASKAQYCGTPFLAKKLNTILMHHIKATLPEIKSKINGALAKYTNELELLGDPTGMGDNASLLLSVITKFCEEFGTALDGKNPDTNTNELSGGARIGFVFHEIFANAINGIDPFDQVKDADIRTIVCNSSGASPALFIGSAAFEIIVKQQIKRFEDPCLKCINLVYDELVRILSSLLNKPSFRRYPALKEKFNSTVKAFFRKCISPTNVFVQDLILMETTYINTAHPDFLSGSKAVSIVNEKMNPRPVPNTPADPRYTKPNQSNDTDSNTGFFSNFLTRKKKPSSIMEPPPPVLKASSTLNEREQTEIEVMKLLIQSYYNVVKKTVVDFVPKAISLKIIHKARDELQRELIKELYNPDMLEFLLKESDSTVQRRKECVKMISALNKAAESVSTV